MTWLVDGVAGLTLTNSQTCGKRIKPLPVVIEGSSHYGNGHWYPMGKTQHKLKKIERKIISEAIHGKQLTI